METTCNFARRRAVFFVIKIWALCPQPEMAGGRSRKVVCYQGCTLSDSEPQHLSFSSWFQRSRSHHKSYALTSALWSSVRHPADNPVLVPPGQAFPAWGTCTLRDALPLFIGHIGVWESSRYCVYTGVPMYTVTLHKVVLFEIQGCGRSTYFIIHWLHFIYVINSKILMQSMGLHTDFITKYKINTILPVFKKNFQVYYIGCYQNDRRVHTNAKGRESSL